VDLTERSARDGVALERFEDLVGVSDVLLYDALDVVVRRRWDVVLELYEFVYVSLRDDVGARRKNLSQLDVRRTEVDERVLESPCAAALLLGRRIASGTEQQPPVPVACVRQRQRKKPQERLC
jgi:hypothetical protein